MSRPQSQLEMQPVYGFSHALVEIIYQICFRGDIAGLENLPGQGGYIVAANHASLLDPPIVGLYVPHQVRFFARQTLWKPGIAAWWLDAVGCIPVDRDGGRDVAALRGVLHALKDERVVILFPEGTRSPDGRLQAPKPGIGFIACHSRAPVVPARIFGSYEAFGRGGRLRLGSPVTVTYGRPLMPADYDDPAAGRDRSQRAAQRIMDAIAALEPPPTVVL
jgi:1-acyl-sn-glycerol-3-phosphate acyltransferase